MRMQYKLLDEHDDSKTTAFAVDLIKGMADGTRVHHASALKFGLREGFSLVRPIVLQTQEQAPQIFGFGTQSRVVGKKPGNR